MHLTTKGQCSIWILLCIRIKLLGVQRQTECQTFILFLVVNKWNFIDFFSCLTITVYAVKLACCKIILQREWVNLVFKASTIQGLVNIVSLNSFCSSYSFSQYLRGAGTGGILKQNLNTLTIQKLKAPITTSLSNTDWRKLQHILSVTVRDSTAGHESLQFNSGPQIDQGPRERRSQTRRF